MEWRRILLVAGIGIAVYAGMRYLLPTAIPFLLGWLLASLILPAAKWIEKKMRIKRSVAGGILLGTLSLGLVFGLWKISDSLLYQVKNLMENLGLWVKQADGFFNTCCQTAESYLGIDANEMRNFLVYQAGKMQEEIQNRFGTEFVGYFFTMVKGVVALCGGILIMIIFGTLVIKDMELFREKMNKGRISGRIMSVGKKICAAGGCYIKAQFILMGIVSLVCMAGFWLLDNPYFVVSGVVVGVLDALPLIGAGTILIPWALIWCLQGRYLMAAGYLALYLTADLIRQFLEPHLLGKEMGIHPALMLVLVYVGFFLYGIAGFFLGPVTYLIIKTIWEEVETGGISKNQ